MKFSCHLISSLSTLLGVNPVYIKNVGFLIKKKKALCISTYMSIRMSSSKVYII